MSNTKSLKRIALLLFSVFLIIFLIGGGISAYFLFKPNFAPQKTSYIYIYPDKDFSNLCLQLEYSANCKNIKTFKEVAKYLKYPEKMRTGRYAVEPGMNNLDLMRSLRNGNQVPVRVTFNNVRIKEDLADRLSEQIMIQSHELLDWMNDNALCESLGFEPHTIKAMFIPNTYEVYWNISAESFMQRMKREYNTFWNESRQYKASKIGISPVEVSILASIVEEESAVVEEYPIIAGLYINRLHKGIPLQADPTVKYALGDFAIQRVLNEHLKIDSPYNTYLHAGLPPGPIRIPSIKGIDAVLNYRQHNYLYMCAKEDFSGRHNFAVTLADHNRNANRYRAALNQLGIR
ncbi:MAG: endolytic transglycosylase MltG [Tannerella sp.]|jgi:UPF0755 protein|nr:endolytic transglycosylase MltG [Tannerella sp.]